MNLQMDFLQTAKNHPTGNRLVLCVLCVIVVVFLIVQPSFLSIEEARNLFIHQDSKVALYLISFLLMLLCALTPMPAEVIALGNALVFSPTEAFCVTWMSAVASASIGYELGRLSEYDPCKINKDGKVCRLLNKHGYKGLAIMRLIPVVPFFALNIGGGIFKLNRRKFVVITAVTIAPAIALLTFFPQFFM